MYSNICGNNPRYWDDFLSERDIEPNSILAGYTIYQHFLDKTNDETKALKKYKGIQKNYWIIDKYNRVLNEVKQKHIKEK